MAFSFSSNTKRGVLNKTSLEAIAAAQKLAGDTGQKVTAVVLGSDRAGERDCRLTISQKLFRLTNDKLADYTPDAYADALEQVVQATRSRNT